MSEFTDEYLRDTERRLRLLKDERNYLRMENEALRKRNEKLERAIDGVLGELTPGTKYEIRGRVHTLRMWARKIRERQRYESELTAWLDRVADALSDLDKED